MAEAQNAVRIRFYVDIDSVGQGTSGSTVYNAAANNPGLGAVGIAQTLRIQQMEPVIAANPALPTQTEIRAAITAGSVDLNAQITAAVTAQIQGWASGQP